MRRLVYVCFTAVAWINVLVSGALPPRGQVHNPDLMRQIVHQGLFPDKPGNVTFLEYFQDFTDVNEDLAKILQKLEFNVLDSENMENAIKLAEDVKRLKEIKMAALEAERANITNARRHYNMAEREPVFIYKKNPTAWTSDARRKIIQLMQHVVYSSRYEINKLRGLRKRYENSTVLKIGVLFGNQMEVKVTAGSLFSTMLSMNIKKITMLWYVFHYTRLMNLAQDVYTNMESMYLLFRHIQEGHQHLAWYRGEKPLGSSMPTNSMEATTLDPDKFYKNKKKKK